MEKLFEEYEKQKCLVIDTSGCLGVDRERPMCTGGEKMEDGSFEYGSLFYIQMKRDPKAYTKGSKW